MTEYEVIWRITVRKKMPVGHYLMGENPLYGEGPTVVDAFRDARDKMLREDVERIQKLGVLSGQKDQLD